MTEAFLVIRALWMDTIWLIAQGRSHSLRIRWLLQGRCDRDAGRDCKLVQQHWFAGCIEHDGFMADENSRRKASRNSSKGSLPLSVSQRTAPREVAMVVGKKRL
eukprot:6153800-Pleurochrysis_carterae.AAC.1